MNVLRSLTYRPFAWLRAGQTTSRLGDSLYRIALSGWVPEKTGSAVAMGTVLIFFQTPLLFFLLIGGVVVDRLSRFRVMFVSEVLCGLVIAFVAFFSWLNLLQIWHIDIASIVFGFVEAFFFPAYQVVVPEITPSALLPFVLKLPVPVLVASMFISGMATSVFVLIWTHTLQEMVPGNMLGRVYSIDAWGSFVLLPIGFALAGWGRTCSARPGSS